MHLAELPDGTEVAVKILRPGIASVIGNDLALLHAAASFIERHWAEGRRLKPHAVVGEFAKHLENELDLMREAANASQLRRNFEGSPLLLVPEVYWDYCAEEVMVMQRMHGTPVNQVDALREQGVDIPRLARAGVEIFFTQVFRDGFFHADMHPGNILVSPQGRYIALDFGIMGTLTELDKHYLAQNFLGFFRRDYQRVALAHIESGWAPPNTRVDEFEAAIRAVCEPVFDRPMKDISFGRVLLRLFQTSRRFNIEVQPQLVLLQKTLLNIEGLGRQLDPDLDLWTTAKPFLERWMSEQLGWRGFVRRVREEAPNWAVALPQAPAARRPGARPSGGGADRGARSCPACRAAAHQPPARDDRAAARGDRSLGLLAIARAALAAMSSNLIWFVMIYLVVSIAIGLGAALRVHSARDFVAAGRHLPLPSSSRRFSPRGSAPKRCSASPPPS